VPALTQERKEFVWISECDEAFNNIKHILVTAPSLRPLNVEKELFL